MSNKNIKKSKGAANNAKKDNKPVEKKKSDNSDGKVFNSIEETKKQSYAVPSGSPEALVAVENLNLISEVFKKIEEETAEIAELIFEFLLQASDAEIMTGTIPSNKNSKINKYVKLLNRLFKFSRGTLASGGYRIINRKMIENLDKKTYAISMVYDGGVSLDILCDIVNVENNSRTPTRSPVKVMVKQAFSTSVDKVIS